MAQPTEFVQYVCERLAPVGRVSVRSMFGGWGLYVDNQFCAIVHRDTLYLKADDMTRPDFEAKGCGPFKPFADKATILSYHEAPAEVLEDAAEMLVWGHKALNQAAPRRRLAEFEQRSVLTVETHEREIVGQVDRQQLELALGAVRARVLQPVGLGLQRDLRDHVIVGDGEAVGADEEA